MSDRLRVPSSVSAARTGAPFIPRVLSIAGSDPSGGAGIQADLKSISANGGFGMAALTALTAQNTQGVRDVHVPPVSFLRAQLEALAVDIQIDAVKIGMLANEDVIVEVGRWLAEVRPEVVVIDPVMVATSGDRLLDPAAEDALRRLLPLAHLVTPNLRELAVLTGREIGEEWDAALDAAEQLSLDLGTAVLVKGGHLAGAHTPDALVDAARALRQEFPGSRIDTTHTHGTGCSLSSALATRRASGEDWPTAVASARAWLRESLEAADELQVGSGSGPVHHFAGLWARGSVMTRPQAEQLASDWWEIIRPIRDGIDELPFIRALADGTLAHAPFVFYLAQDALYLREYARVLAEAARIAPTSEEQAFWAGSAQGAIAGELELHASWLTPAQGITAETFAAAQAPATTAYLDHLRAIAFDGDYAVLIAALLPCFWLYSDLGERLHAGAFGEYARDPEHPYASWLATYADPAFAESTQQAIAFVAQAAASASPEVRERMLRAFTAASQHELAFFAAPLTVAL
ncbi:bifunctional hydroxymethylpyrimidine kinase/phosphomethylpyrimidine kinase [Microbacterium keratanolyticum]|uniref:bifunctional hydroxymethylpyrimidine kinase/phosphomethylpyrimidine kinase n=1 Tax=Microbacterium keratanolyticum TaxID=67574 RepID=UPI00363C779D